ncbi:hypothetical protein N7532_010898 [Penicillium argentinense]|uniref:WD repeat-containing protein n=1 Tax=Penicillium argentinense TaxID=1131581 RepID=A0A9W9EQH8_9EURO|nr:uncharacterized protein N7532_010898 [Penicillium argentinense]KAJ5086127.1 hypothetical protein N7532_010898 [Penicillium argentinense]
MKDSLYDLLWRRECGDRSPYAALRSIYGHQEWINDLDIVNELGGHTGCVNALSWSRSGRLLASGSDDQHLNIYLYQPESSSAPFELNTTVLTGHRANIFSVKFMPHSNDTTVVTCAGDSQVRVFDIEYSSQNNVAATSAFDGSARSQRFNHFFNGARYLSAANTNARVYKSHADRVKRIVTESSPYLFLTCSEDGEVRQWDLRLPSSAYPQPQGGQGFMAYRPGLHHDDSNVPRPLISYKQFGLDLNTISCSPTQPHYIALGGAHMHCFLHDRRMLGRDTTAEKGAPSVSPPIPGSVDDETMVKSTQCVRRFAPRGKRRLRQIEEGHITACKISDANPDEIIVSYSGDHIYSFDLIRSPDARDQSSEVKQNSNSSSTRRNDSNDNSRIRKRKRPKPASMSSQGSGESGDRHHSQRRSGEPDTFRVHYENGESDDIPFSTLSEEIDSPTNMLERARYSVLNDAQKMGMEIAKGLVKLRKSLFSLETAAREAMGSDPTSPPAGSFSIALTLASENLPRMSDVIRKWRYPMNPSQETVAFQQTLRRNRQASWRFVQAAGALAHALEMNDDSEDDWPQFKKVLPAPNEDGSIEQEAQFGYDFLKAILLWLKGGRQELLAGFKGDSYPPRVSGRFPIPADAGEEAIDGILIPYLLNLAGDSPIVNVDASRFELADSRVLFQTQRAAVAAFGNAVKLPLENLGNRAARIDKRRVSNSSSNVRSLDRESATRFWVLRVGRGILMDAGNGVNFAFVNRAFGGLHTAIMDESESEGEGEMVERSQDDIDPNVEEEPIRAVNLVRRQTISLAGAANRSSDNDVTSGEDGSPDQSRIGGDRENDDDQSESESSNDDEFELESDSGDEANIDIEMSDSGSEEPYEDGDEESAFLHFGGRKPRRVDVERDVPCSPHTRVYRGHCNIKTVKDVNFFGLNDEYVVSGSDCGRLFIWDRKTTELLNILEGDSEVVNVVQGHPYEPMLAVSGIDNTIKIFSSDRHAQDQARRGVNILDPDNAANVLGTTVSNIGGLESRQRIDQIYRIMSENDVERRGGVNDAFVTRHMLTRLAATLRGRQGASLGGGIPAIGGEAGENATIILDDNCQVM